MALVSWGAQPTWSTLGMPKMNSLSRQYASGWTCILMEGEIQERKRPRLMGSEALVWVTGRVTVLPFFRPPAREQTTIS
jgi:hypothetical protein